LAGEHTTGVNRPPRDRPVFHSEAGFQLALATGISLLQLPRRRSAQTLQDRRSWRELTMGLDDLLDAVAQG